MATLHGKNVALLERRHGEELAALVPDVIPGTPNMPSLIDALAEYFESSIPEEPHPPVSILVS
jgi:hypothetical protein